MKSLQRREYFREQLIEVLHFLPFMVISFNAFAEKKADATAAFKFQSCYLIHRGPVRLVSYGFTCYVLRK